MLEIKRTPIEFILRLPDAKADAALVDMARDEMRKRLAEQSAKGFNGWQGPHCTNAGLLELLKNNLAQGDMVDVMNLAAMIHARTLLYGETA